MVTGRAVAPSAYVELRALEISQAEIERLGHRAEPKERPFAHFLKRLWPFDYPAKPVDPSPPALMTPAIVANAKGRYLDVIV